MGLNAYGDVVNKCIADLSNRYSNIELDKYVVMPDHIHGIIKIIGDGMPGVGAIHELPLQTQPNPMESIRKQRRKMLLPMIVGYLKMNSAKQINIIRKTPNFPIWQRNYYEHIIRNNIELERIRNYITRNPSKWKKHVYIQKNN